MRMKSTLFVLPIFLALGISACIEKPASEPSAATYFLVQSGNLTDIDRVLGSYASDRGFRYKSGNVGNNDQMYFTIHLVRSDAQIIAVDSFRRNCFEMSYYKTLRIGRATDEEIGRLKHEMDLALQDISGVTLLTEADAKEMGC